MNNLIVNTWYGTFYFLKESVSSEVLNVGNGTYTVTLPSHIILKCGEANLICSPVIFNVSITNLSEGIHYTIFMQSYVNTLLSPCKLCFLLLDIVW